MGGHSGGASSWYDLAHHTLIDTDGFNLSRDGEVLEGVYVEWGSSSAYGKAIPRIRLAHRGIGLLAKLHRNMSIRDVERALRLRLADGEATHPGLIRYSKKLINKEDDRYTQWRLRCSFGPKGLEGFAVSCD